MIIKQATDPINVDALRILIYGQPGSKKTSWSFSAPRPLLLDFDGGVKRVAPKYRGAYAPIKNWKEALGLFSADLSAYDTIIIDTVGKALEALAVQITADDFKLKRKDGSLTMQGFGAMGNKFKDFLSRLTALGKHVVLIAHDKESKNGDDTVIRPDITGQSLANIMREVDLCGYIQSFNNRSTVTFNPSDAFYGKNTCSLPERMETVDTTLASVIELAIANMNEDTEQYRTYKEQLAEVERMVNNCETADDLNDLLLLLKERTFVSDGKLQVGQMLKSRAAELGAIFDAKTKQYHAEVTV
jgi:hypothetical protein